MRWFRRKPSPTTNPVYDAVVAALYEVPQRWRFDARWNVGRDDAHTLQRHLDPFAPLWFMHGDTATLLGVPVDFHDGAGTWLEYGPSSISSRCPHCGEGSTIHFAPHRSSTIYVS